MDWFKIPRCRQPPSCPTPAAEANADGSTTIYFIAKGNWIQTDPNRGWFIIIGFYSLLQPFLDKSWRMGEVELVQYDE